MLVVLPFASLMKHELACENLVIIILQYKDKTGVDSMRLMSGKCFIYEGSFSLLGKIIATVCLLVEIILSMHANCTSTSVEKNLKQDKNKSQETAFSNTGNAETLFGEKNADFFCSFHPL